LKKFSKAFTMFGTLEKLDDIVGFILLVIAVLVIVANAMVCLLVVTNKRLRTDVNGFVVSLAMSDIITAAVTLLNFLSVVHQTKTETEITFVTISVRFITLSGVANLCAMAYDRYMAVVKPFQYKTRSRKFFVGIVAAVWVGSACVSLLYFLRLSSVSISILNLINQFVILFFIVAPFVFMVVMYVCIFMVIRKQRRRTRDLQAAQRRPIAIRQKREIKIVKIFLVVATLYIVSWIPLALQETVRKVKDFHLPGFKTNFVIHLFVFGAGLSSLMNPFIYAFAKQDFRREIQRIYRKRRHGTAPSIPDRN